LEETSLEAFCKWEDNNKIGRKDIADGDVGWIQLAEAMFQ
jgi:hypothetical protein